MIYLKEKNILFLKARKVAGTSFEIALSKFADKDDIVTPVSAVDEKIRRSLGFRPPQNYQKPVSEWTPSDAYRFIRHKHYPEKYYNHISAKEVRNLLGVRAFDSAYKISIVRNPFDFLVSYYFWRRQGALDQIAFVEWLRRNPQLFRMNEAQYLIDGKDIIDHYLRYEHLSDDILALETKRPEITGLRNTLNSINAKTSSRPKGERPETKFGNQPELAAAVLFFNKRIIETFGYQPT